MIWGDVGGEVTHSYVTSVRTKAGLIMIFCEGAQECGIFANGVHIVDLVDEICRICRDVREKLCCLIIPGT